MTRPLPTADVVQGRAFTLDIPARSESIPVLDEKVTVSVRVFDGMQRVVQTYTEPRACSVDRFGETVRLSLSPSDTAELPLGTMFYDVVLAHADGRNDVPSSGFWRVRPEPPVTPPGPSFAHHVFLDHDHAQQDALRYVAPWGSPVPDAVVQVFLRADYVAGLERLRLLHRLYRLGCFLVAALHDRHDHFPHGWRSGVGTEVIAAHRPIFPVLHNGHSFGGSVQRVAENYVRSFRRRYPHGHLFVSDRQLRRLAVCFPSSATTRAQQGP
jgi:hypothetical protein